MATRGPAGADRAPSVVTPRTRGEATGFPGVRAFRVRWFRMGLAAVLCLIAVFVLGSVLVRQAAQPLEVGQLGIDFADYVRAAERLTATGSPYAREMLDGPVPAQGTDRFRYPPVVAQVLAPVVSIGREALTSAWLVLQALAAWAAVAIALLVGPPAVGAARARRTDVESLLWAAVAAAFFLPVFDTLWKGNVSGLVMLVVGLALHGGRSGSTAAVAGGFVKLVPGLLLLPLAWRRRNVAAGAACGVAVAAVSVVLSPAAWRDYAIVLPNLLTGSADYATNLAPASLLRGSALDGLGNAVRVATVGGSIALLAAAVLVGRQQHRVPLAVLLATLAMLLLPAAIWFHYLSALLPVAAAAWRVGRIAERGALVLGSAFVSAGVAWLPLAAIGALVLAIAAGIALARDPIAPTEPVNIRWRPTEATA